MADEHLKEAISEYEIGNKVIARQILAEVLTNDPGDEQAWLLLAAYAETDEQKLEALQRASAINPQNQYNREALSEPGVVAKPGRPEKGEPELVEVAKIGPGLARKTYDYIEPLEELPLAAARGSKPVEFIFPRRARGKWFWASIGLLAGVIVLWGVFFILLINGQGPRIFAGAGSQTTPSTSVASEASDTPQKTQPVPENTPVSTPQPEVTLEATAASIPTLGLPSVIQSPAGTRSEPVQVGSGYRFKGYGVMAVAGFSLKTGQVGLAIVNLTFACERPVQEICATEMFTFELVSSSGLVYLRNNDPSIPKPWFGTIANLPTYGGATERGNVGFTVTNPESGILLKIGNTLEPGSDVYFTLP